MGVIAKLSIKGDGSENNAFRPALPFSLNEELQNYANWEAWYYPKNAPYQYCIVIVKPIKTLPIQIDSLKLTVQKIQSEYPDCFKAFTLSEQILRSDPPPESYNFDSDTVGLMPSGWSVGSGTMTVQNDQYYSSPNSFKQAGGGGLSYVATTRSDTTLISRIRTGIFGTYGNIDLVGRYQDVNNLYRFGFRKDSSVRTLKIYKRVATTWTQLASKSYSWTDSTWYYERVDILGTNARMYVNSVLEFDWTALGSDFASGYNAVRNSGDGQSGWFDDVLFLDYGWNMKINGISNATLSKINSLSRTLISKVNGV